MSLCCNPKAFQPNHIDQESILSLRRKVVAHPAPTKLYTHVPRSALAKASSTITNHGTTHRTASADKKKRDEENPRRPGLPASVAPKNPHGCGTPARQPNHPRPRVTGARDQPRTPRGTSRGRVDSPETPTPPGLGPPPPLALAYASRHAPRFLVDDAAAVVIVVARRPQPGHPRLSFLCPIPCNPRLHTVATLPSFSATAPPPRAHAGRRKAKRTSRVGGGRATEPTGNTPVPSLFTLGSRMRGGVGRRRRRARRGRARRQ